MNEMQEDKHILEEAPLLFGMEKRLPEMPENYLDHLDEVILKRISIQENVGKIIGINPIFKWAAAAAIVCIVWFFSMNKEYISDVITEAFVEDLDLGTLTVDEVDDYLELDDDLMMEVFLDDVPMDEPSAEMEYLIHDDQWNDEMLIEL